MTLQELYQQIGGDYDQALRVLRVHPAGTAQTEKMERTAQTERMAQMALTAWGFRR